MAEGQGFDDRYVRYREHVETKEELQAQLAELKLANARIADLPAKFDEFAKEMRAMRYHSPPAAPAQDQTLLMLHRLLDAAAKSSGGASLIERLLTWAAFALFGGVAAHLMGL